MVIGADAVSEEGNVFGAWRFDIQNESSSCREVRISFGSTD